MAISKKINSWFVYLVRCADNSLYTGITNDLTKRVLAHNSPKGGARYTRARQPVELVYSEPCDDRSTASKREFAIKKMTRPQKDKLLTGGR